eukprot:g27086.t1
MCPKAGTRGRGRRAGACRASLPLTCWPSRSCRASASNSGIRLFRFRLNNTGACQSVTACTGGQACVLPDNQDAYSCVTPFHVFRPSDKFCAEPLTEAVFEAGFSVQLQLSPEACARDPPFVFSGGQLVYVPNASWALTNDWSNAWTNTWAAGTSTTRFAAQLRLISEVAAVSQQWTWDASTGRLQSQNAHASYPGGGFLNTDDNRLSVYGVASAASAGAVGLGTGFVFNFTLLQLNDAGTTCLNVKDGVDISGYPYRPLGLVGGGCTPSPNNMLSYSGYGNSTLRFAYVGDGGWCLYNGYDPSCGVCGGANVASTLVRCNSVSLKPTNLQWRVSSTTVWVVEANGPTGSLRASYVNANGHYVHWTNSATSNVGVFLDSDTPSPPRAGFHLYRPSDGYCAEPVALNSGTWLLASPSFPLYTSSNTQHSGAWGLSGSSVLASDYDLWKAFDASSGNGWVSQASAYLGPGGTYQAAISTAGIPGEWVQIRRVAAPALTLYSFVYTTRSFGNSWNAYPRRLAVLGSVENSDTPTSWTVLYRSIGDEPAWTLDTRTFALQSTGAYRVYRWVFESVYTATNGPIYAEMGELSPRFSVAVGTSSHLTWQIHRSSYAYNQNGDYEVGKAFDNEPDSAWASSSISYAAGTGELNSGTTTQGIQGEWVQVRSASGSAVTLTGFRWQPQTNAGDYYSSPKELTVLGSTENSDSPGSWTVLYETRQGTLEPFFGAGIAFTLMLNQTGAFRVYRWVLRSLYVNLTRSADLGELYLYVDLADRHALRFTPEACSRLPLFAVFNRRYLLYKPDPRFALINGWSNQWNNTWAATANPTRYTVWLRRLAELTDLTQAQWGFTATGNNWTVKSNFPNALFPGGGYLNAQDNLLSVYGGSDAASVGGLGLGLPPALATAFVQLSTGGFCVHATNGTDPPTLSLSTTCTQNANNLLALSGGRLRVPFRGPGDYCLANDYAPCSGDCGQQQLASYLVSCDSVSLRPDALRWQVESPTQLLHVWSGRRAYLSTTANSLFVSWSSASTLTVTYPTVQSSPFQLYRLTDNFCAGPLPGARFVNGGAVALLFSPEACWQPASFVWDGGRILYLPRRDWALSNYNGPFWTSWAGGTRYAVMLRQVSTLTDTSQLWTYNATAQTIIQPLASPLYMNTEDNQLGLYTTVTTIGVGSGPVMFSRWDPPNAIAFQLTSNSLCMTANTGGAVTASACSLLGANVLWKASSGRSLLRIPLLGDGGYCLYNTYPGSGGEVASTIVRCSANNLINPTYLTWHFTGFTILKHSATLAPSLYDNTPRHVVGSYQPTVTTIFV